MPKLKKMVENAKIEKNFNAKFWVILKHCGYFFSLGYDNFVAKNENRNLTFSISTRFVPPLLLSEIQALIWHLSSLLKKPRKIVFWMGDLREFWNVL